MIDRPLYLNKLLKLVEADTVVLITGVRRCGKSTLLALYENHLRSEMIVDEQIININYESSINDKLRNPRALHTYIKQHISNHKYDQYYLLVDEVQEVENWANALNSLRVSYPLTICATGSNSKLFAGEHLTYIAGRYVELKMLPLSLEEFDRFVMYYPDNDLYPSDNLRPISYERSFQEYLSAGSFPAVALAKSEEVKTALLQGILDSVVIRDVVARGKIDNDAIFRRVAQFMFDNIGSSVSLRKIADTLKTAGNKISISTVERYINLFCDAFILYRCPRYDVHGKKLLTTSPKYYIVDLGLRNTFLGERPRDYGHILENLVFLELLRRGYEVAVGRVRDMEIDFVATRQTSRIYVQVTQTLAEDVVETREYKPLLAIKDAYPKYVMSLDEFDYSNRGITHIRIQDFLRGAEL